MENQGRKQQERKPEPQRSGQTLGEIAASGGSAAPAAEARLAPPERQPLMQPKPGDPCKTPGCDGQLSVIGSYIGRVMVDENGVLSQYRHQSLQCRRCGKPDPMGKRVVPMQFSQTKPKRREPINRKP